MTDPRSSDVNHKIFRVAEIFSARVRQARKRADLTRQALVERINANREGTDERPLTVATLEAIEGGRRKSIAVEEVLEFAAALGVSPVYLLFPEDREVIVQVAPHLAMRADLALGWFQAFPPPDDEDVPIDFEDWYSTVPSAHLDSRLGTGWDDPRVLDHLLRTRERLTELDPARVLRAVAQRYAATRNDVELMKALLPELADHIEKHGLDVLDQEDSDG